MAEAEMLEVSTMMWGNAISLKELAFEISTTRTIAPRPLLAYLVGAFGTICVAASLKFMWDIRH